MQILDVIPLTNIPRPTSPVFTYYYAKPLPRFSLVWTLVGRKKTPALVVDSRPMRDIKQYLRKSSRFTLKEIEAVVQESPVLFDWQFTLAQWLASYYWSSLGFVLKKFIPAYVINNKQLTAYNIQPELEKKINEQRLFLLPNLSFFERVVLPKNYLRISSILSKKRELQVFETIASGEVTDIAGTRGVVFAPFNKLKEVHIYEEIDANHKSWEQRPKFHAVRVAQELARLHHAHLIYHSTLPSVSLYAQKIPYESLEEKVFLPEPKTTLINLTKETLSSPFSEIVRKLLQYAGDHNKTVILYVNRRGRDRVLLCRDCGFSSHCPNCSTPLALHAWVKGKPRKTLLCHHCGYEEAPPTLCANCGSHQIRSYGFGTERVEQELRKLFPEARVWRLDSDRVISDRMKQDIANTFVQEGQFLVTTSMLFSTKQHPANLVIALNPDSELNVPDFGQNEKLFFNLWRLRNWAAEAFYVQTYNPDSLLMKALVSGNWQHFYEDELAVRQALSYPPFSSIIKLTFEHSNEAKAHQQAQMLYNKLVSYVSRFTPEDKGVQLLGPAPAFLSKLKGKHRYTILMKLQATNYTLKAHLLSLVPPTWDVDVDPVDSL